MLVLTETQNAWRFKARLQPRSSRNAVVGLHGDALKIKIKAPPVEGAANRMCIRHLAECLDVPRSAVEIVSGRSSRIKTVQVRCDSPADRSSLKQAILALSRRGRTDG